MTSYLKELLSWTLEWDGERDELVVFSDLLRFFCVFHA